AAQAVAYGWLGLQVGGDDAQAAQQARKTIMLASGTLPVAVLHRFGRIINAANSKLGTLRRSGGDDDGANLLGLLVLATSQAINGGSWGRQPDELHRIWSLDRLAQCIAETGAAPTLLAHMLYGPKDYFWDQFAHSSPGLKEWLVANEALVAGVADKL